MPGGLSVARGGPGPVCAGLCPRMGVGVCSCGLSPCLKQPALRERLFSLRGSPLSSYSTHPQSLCKPTTLAAGELGRGEWRLGPRAGVTHRCAPGALVATPSVLLRILLSTLKQATPSSHTSTIRQVTEARHPLGCRGPAPARSAPFPSASAQSTPGGPA